MTGRLLKRRLLEEGATVVGLADVAEALPADIRHLERAVAIGLSRSLKEKTIRELARLQKVAEGLIRDAGGRIFSIPPDSDRVKGKFAARLYPLFPHKIAATCAGIGWIGKNGLLISPVHGPKLALATVLTDLVFEVDEPITRSRCGSCSFCVEHCPSGAITGQEWSREDPFPNLFESGLCRAHKAERQMLGDRPNCGLCITICPYGRRTETMVAGGGPPGLCETYGRSD